MIPLQLVSNKNKKPSPSLRDELYHRAPIDLSREEVPIKNILLIGACFSNALALQFKRKVFTASKEASVDHIVTHHIAPLPSSPPKAIDEYSFQIVQIPLRVIMNESSYLHLDYHDIKGHREAFEESVKLLELFFDYLLQYNTEHHLTTFVTNFFLPQQNLMGRFLPAYDLRNISYYIDQLNKRLSELVHARSNVYFIDANEIAASLGRRYIQDDIFHVASHGALVSDSDFRHDQKRLHPPKRYSQGYTLRADSFIDALWHEIAAHYKTLRQQDAIKIVICDLDDTLWRGVFAEEGMLGPGLEGWPLGVMEALLFLKKRGILLAIASNNEEELILKEWQTLFQNYLRPEDFVVKKINRRDKCDNIQEILQEVHLLPGNALFLDDNPVEREKVQRAFPEIRTLGADLYHIKRVLLWAPELQAPHISQESSQRTQSIQAQREHAQKASFTTREEFLESLQLRIEIMKIDHTAHPHFARAFELLNKTNQFNTTGKRWTPEECTDFFKKKGFFYVFQVADKFTTYGLVGVVLIQDHHLLQFVMSCRVLGLDIEKSVLTRIIHHLNGAVITAEVIETPANFICRDFFGQMGFTKKGSFWHYEKDKLSPIGSK
ncbi:MAG: HAD-IIIC family phosphatase [Chthoniobacterales bacterium]|nr:HAD-IIIC family phosphatase [Chthoniobacterales bacterium]